MSDTRTTQRADSVRAPDHPAPVSIGPVRLATNLLLAPVANYCDLAWRITCRELGGLGLACTDLLSPHGLLRGTAQSLDLASTNQDDRPLCMQLYGGEPDILAQGALWAVDHGATVIDINMGCPVDKVTKKDGGSKLLCTPDRTVLLAQTVVRAVERATRGRVPVTAKLRLGWDDSCIVAPDLAVALARVGISAITVHGRTTEQMFKGGVRHEGIRAVVEAVRAALGPPEQGGPPVIGNGDVLTPELAQEMIHRTGCAGVMIGRGSFARPWIFRRAWALLTTGEPGPEPDEPERIAIVRRYFELMLRFRDEHYALNHMRRRISWMGKALGPCKPLKERVRTARSPADIHDALDEFLAGGLRVFSDGAGAEPQPV
ncbi:MAG TPA: tRNA dihydrouridine synthase DusB [Phycisphaerales bacterium]|nr:tRNA dihydrouridine synthase DusB [Phycisphaerales bacterium]